MSASDIQSPLKKLERMSGNPGYDVRMSAEIIGKTHMVVRSLGLDPNDSTADEVYAATNHLLKLHNQFFIEHIGVDDDDPNKIVEAVTRYIHKLHYPRTTCLAKASVIKKMLKTVPPKRSMKQLGYRSIDSMLKREPIAHVLGVAKHMEGKTWHKQYYKQYEKLRPIDFEERAIEVHHPTSRYWNKLGVTMSKKLQSNVLSVEELGAVIVLPLPKKQWPNTAITVFVLTLLAINEIRMFGSFFKLQQVNEQFGQHITNAVTHKGNMQADIGGDSVHWRVVHGFFAGGSESSEPPEVFVPHLTVEDFALRKVEKTLANIEPAFQFWHGNEYVGGFFKGSDKPVSFNLLDAIINSSNELSVDQRIAINMRSSLWDEMVMRYLGSNTVRSIVLRQLAGQEFEFDDQIHNAPLTSDTL